MIEPLKSLKDKINEKFEAEADKIISNVKIKKVAGSNPKIIKNSQKNDKRIKGIKKTK